MDARFLIVNGEELPKYGLEAEDGERYFIIERMTDTTARILGSDGGEPEDQTLHRDWNWVAGALEDAYKAGYSKGREDEINERACFP